MAVDLTIKRGAVNPLRLVALDIADQRDHGQRLCTGKRTCGMKAQCFHAGRQREMSAREIALDRCAVRVDCFVPDRASEMGLRLVDDVLWANPALVSWRSRT